MRRKNTLLLCLIAMLLTTALTSIGTSASMPKVYVEPAEIVDRTGSITEFSVSVMIADVVDLYSYSVRVNFDPTVVKIPDEWPDWIDWMTVHPGFCWLATSSGFTAETPIVVAENDLGYIFVSQYLDPDVATNGANGDGLLVTINFEVTGTGVTDLVLDPTKLSTVIAGNNVPIDHVAEDGLFDNRENIYPPHALFEVSKTYATENEELTFDASTSHDMDDNGTIVNYEWDFGYDANHADKWFAFGISQTDMWLGDGMTKSFITTEKPVEGSEKVYVNGSCTHDYTIDYETSNITLATAPWINASVQADYLYVGQKTFVATEKPVIPGSEEVYVNGILMTQPVDYSIDYETGYITFVTPPDLGAIIEAFYSTRAQASGMTATHAFPLAGDYLVTLTVTDNDDLTDTLTCTITIVSWIVGGDIPDLVGWEAKPERKNLYESAQARGMDLRSMVGNPTEDPYEVYVEFTLYSKDEAKKLGTLTTETVTIIPGEKLELRAYFDASDPTWRCFSGSPDWVPYGYYHWFFHKYSGFASCYHKNLTTGEFVKGIVEKYIGFNVVPMDHDIGVLSVTPSTSVIRRGRTLEIYVDVTNVGDLEHNVDLTIEYIGAGAVPPYPVIDERPVTLAPGETKTETFTWKVPRNLDPGPYLIKASLPILPYETHIGDNALSARIEVK